MCWPFSKTPKQKKTPPKGGVKRTLARVSISTGNGGEIRVSGIDAQNGQINIAGGNIYVTYHADDEDEDAN